MRQRQPFYKASRKTWYWQEPRTGRQINLGPDEAAAWAKFYELVGTKAELTADLRAGYVVDVLARFLEWCESTRSPRTFEFYSIPLRDFAQHIGPKLRLADLRPHHVTNWLRESYGNPGENYRYNLLRAVKRPFLWAVGEGYLAADPLATVKRGRQTPRQTYLEPEHWDRLMAVVPAGAFREFLIALRATGARPEEIRTVEAKHFDQINECWVLPASIAKGGRERVIHLSDAAGAALALTKRLAVEHPTGPLFRNSRGGKWTRRTVNRYFERLREQKKITFPVSCYSIRHTYATDALVAGLDIQTVATQLGHSDLRMVSTIYQKLHKKTAFLKEKQTQATAGINLDLTPTAPDTSPATQS